MKKNAIRFNFKWVLIFWFLTILTLSAATPQKIKVSNIYDPAAANGIYVKQPGTFGAANLEYWKHETQEFYLYFNNYNDGVSNNYYWNLDDNFDINDVLFYGNLIPLNQDENYYKETFPSPHLVSYHNVPSANGSNWQTMNGASLDAITITGVLNDIKVEEVLEMPPVLANLNGNTVSFTEGGASVLIDAGSDVSITDADASGYNGGNLTVSVTGAGANDNLIISTTGAVSLSAGMTNGSNVSVSGTHIGSISTNGQNGNNLVISLNANATNANIATLIQNITYTNDNNDPPASRTVNLTLTDSGSQTSTNSAITVNITGVNDKPTLTSTGSNPTFTEGGAAASLYSGTSISTIEAGQTITELRLTVTNVNNGANEILSVDGSDVALTDANSVNTATNTTTTSVSVAGTTATVTITKAGGITTAQTQTLVNGITYRNTSENPNTSNRVTTLTYIKDNGGTANSGDDDEVLNIASTVTVVAVAPSVNITSASSNPTNVSPFSVTITFSKNVTGFEIGDITVGNGTADNFATTNASTYTADITPTGQGNAVNLRKKEGTFSRNDF